MAAILSRGRWVKHLAIFLIYANAKPSHLMFDGCQYCRILCDAIMS